MSTPSPDADLTGPLAEVGQPRPAARLRAVSEVVLCSGYVTQLAIVGALGSVGIAPATADGALAPRFVFLVSSLDTVLLIGLIVLLLTWGGESPRRVFLGTRPVGPELVVGLGMLGVVFAVVILVQLAIYFLAPFLRTVPQSPFEPLLGSPLLLAGFVGVVLLAGGVREELQRAFLLHRFEQHLGGARVGVIVTSLAFGLGHTLQGWDAAVITALLGAIWAVVYLWRRSVVAAVVSHALFNVGQVVVGYLALESL